MKIGAENIEIAADLYETMSLCDDAITMIFTFFDARSLELAGQVCTDWLRRSREYDPYLQREMGLEVGETFISIGSVALYVNKFGYQWCRYGGYGGGKYNQVRLSGWLDYRQYVRTARLPSVSEELAAVLEESRISPRIYRNVVDKLYNRQTAV